MAKININHIDICQTPARRANILVRDNTTGGIDDM